MLPYDPNGKMGPKKPLPDNVSVVEPKDEVIYDHPESEYKTPLVPLEVPVEPKHTE